ncbi:hypothetical protein EXIGLDRAFT_320836 [Exidia glandulosa HHB12029]|uniref:Uncharacterized protein n=1 Tax=Exidia glandulosa HHB12029 TaxID=1314781 RepID=A0A165Q5W2_EXIGL|nr:hypothetical protein EXIGLDRAFT_320836 [Exidia glandulosa HHB12029]
MWTATTHTTLSSYGARTLVSGRAFVSNISVPSTSTACGPAGETSLCRNARRQSARHAIPCGRRVDRMAFEDAFVDIPHWPITLAVEFRPASWDDAYTVRDDWRAVVLTIHESTYSITRVVEFDPNAAAGRTGIITEQTPAPVTSYGHRCATSTCTKPGRRRRVPPERQCRSHGLQSGDHPARVGQYGQRRTHCERVCGRRMRCVPLRQT